ncbi:hypothetical protein DQ237_00725 [Blastococcus sp. TF02-8]|uniref:PA domain-containing protein n=1 Tax=Blastococcus sp. TF02-8 TaxID=2250574 RepID=UPI000DE95B2F|nr:PA domain-containing protein [Blastococcus sp. TF02-8]RBY97513.1 hypothetical protein DQ237_00725 [Blastococcus sp. TF02-8]
MSNPEESVEPGGIADVAVYGDYAYLAAWGGETCKANGIHVVDISDVTNPREVAFVPSKEGSYPGEGMQVTHISTPSFTGDVLVTNNEICKDTAGFGGMNIYDVTNPARPKPLAVGFGDTSAGGNNQKKTANEIHSVFAWDAGNKAYAVMVDNEEAADVDIVDITNPKKPVLIAEYDLATQFPQILQPEQGLDEVFLHDMIVKEINGRFIMLASYWDAGYVQLDVTDPLHPIYLSDSDFTNPDPEAAESGLTVPPEGNGHQGEFTLDNRYVIGADEDFGPYALTARNVDDGTDIEASQGSGTTPLEEGDTITGESVFVGRACPGDPAVPAGDGTQIAVVERGVCDFTVKVAAVEAAGGYSAILVFNRTASDGCNGSLGMTVEGGIPTFGVAPREQGFAIFDVENQYDDAACLAGDGTQLAPIPVGTTGDTLAFSSYFDGWGYVHLFDSTSMSELDTYAIPEAHDPAFATGFGDLSVHEVATSKLDPNLAYLSYYAGGLRVIDVSSGEIEEVGAFIDQGGNNFWGVETFVQDGVEYVALSDRDYGLYILKYAP